jgi:hypothetical protein
MRVCSSDRSKADRARAAAGFGWARMGHPFFTQAQPHRQQKRAKTCEKCSKKGHFRAAKPCLDALLGNYSVLLALIRNYSRF